MPDARPTFRHKATGDFWILYRQLPSETQALAAKNYALLKEDARHPSLQFKKVGKLWSARIGLYYRAVAIPIPEGFLWIWIGRHDEYDQILKG